jgi:hypothetical protein
MYAYLCHLTLFRHLLNVLLFVCIRILELSKWTVLHRLKSFQTYFSPYEIFGFAAVLNSVEQQSAFVH